MTHHAHSGRAAREGRPAIPPQPYAVHVHGVATAALQQAQEMARFLTEPGQRKPFIACVHRAAMAHDLGKLLPENAEVLSRSYGMDRPTRLPVNHVDAGVAHLMASGDAMSALLVWAHHAGLADASTLCKTSPPLRDPTIHSRVDEALAVCMAHHAQETGDGIPPLPDAGFVPSSSLDHRLALSCLVDADHGDTGRHYGSTSLPDAWPTLRAADRLAALDAFVEKLGRKGGPGDTRNAIRAELYRSARKASPDLGIRSCDSPVGTGKTTSIMAHLLHVAKVHELRRIFVVLPFTNIIDQAVDTYRKALVLDGENPEEVVAAHHHRAEFDAPESRELAFQWRAPIIVVTAVQFFETLAAAAPASLRKLHSLPGSAVFIDEAHAAMPADLWLPAWVWLRSACQRWGCHFVLASGSLSRFWELDQFRDAEKIHGMVPMPVHPLIDEAPRAHAMQAEQRRVRYVSIPRAVGMEELTDSVLRASGPRIVVMNTVRGAAMLAHRLAQARGRRFVEHLSTALCPRDRAATLRHVKQRLLADDSEWVLVATSCVEAGVDFSFRTGFRERFGLCNLIQLGGRVCREAEAEGVVYDFVLRADEVPSHPGARLAALALTSLFGDGLVGQEHCREALRRELALGASEGNGGRGLAICVDDSAGEFRKVHDRFRIIDADTVTVIVDPHAIARLQSGNSLLRAVLQEVTVQIWTSRLEREPIAPIPGWPQLYAWQGVYDDFLGYLADTCANPRHPGQT